MIIPLVFVAVQSLSRVWLWPHGLQHTRLLSFTISQCLLKFMCIDSVQPSDIPSSLPSIQLVIHPAQYFAWCTQHRGDDICHPLLLLPSIFPSIRVISNVSAFHNRWPNYWSLSFSISSSNEYSGLISFRIDLFNLLTIQGTFRNLLQHHSSKESIIGCSAFFMVQLYHPYITTGKTTALTIWTLLAK